MNRRGLILSSLLPPVAGARAVAQPTGVFRTDPSPSSSRFHRAASRMR